MPSYVTIGYHCSHERIAPRSCSNMPGELGMPVSRLPCGPITATRGANGRAIPAHVECACCSRLPDCASWGSAKSAALRFDDLRFEVEAPN